jgi:hypothetical protein
MFEFHLQSKSAAKRQKSSMKLLALLFTALAAFSAEAFSPRMVGSVARVKALRQPPTKMQGLFGSSEAERKAEVEKMSKMSEVH